MSGPDRSPPPPSQAEWLRLAADVVGAAQLRADAHRNVLTIVRCLGWSADWRTSRTRPSMAGLVRRTGLSLRTCQRWCRWLERAGLLVVIEEGTTPRYRSMLHMADGNLAREWQLSRPAEVPFKEAVTPSGLGFDLGEVPTRAHACEAEVKGGAGTATQDEAKPAAPPPAGYPLGAVPRTRRDQLGAAQAIQERAPVLRLLSAEHLRSLLRPFFATGSWTAGDALEAIDHDRDGRQRSYTNPVRHPAGWAAARLAGWQDGGRPVASPSQRRAAERERVRAEQQAARTARQEAAERAARVDVAAQAGRAREMLRSRPRPARL